ncbi:hypothetical protein CLV24_10418 [Pontibacter ummariensis]|uniref:EF hand n=1 Tax=Pontibacter ummariensis TaxID=1610492 RepID=A0A239D4E2_9BACT|nr:hypothetical protein [Pontibacter ummariensis]PRY14208.1 hypothetical protein CLV24_10418 [Pontibacter ummariensis]SNS26483.1 hypothetical protein SAMN06296052_10418 [Pontibacter ummariensis]
MKKHETSLAKLIRNGLCLFLVGGMVACGGETEVADEGAVADAEVTEEVAVADTWDANEFNTTFASTDYYEGWDVNDDNFLDENEYRTGFYDTWDVNDDNQLDENEWNTGTRDWGVDNAAWAGLDTSGDGFVDENEYNTGFDTAVWFGEWDQDDDNLLSEREYTDGVFGQWDENDDAALDENEYRLYTVYYGV